MIWATSCLDNIETGCLNSYLRVWCKGVDIYRLTITRRNGLPSLKAIRIFYELTKEETPMQRRQKTVCLHFNAKTRTVSYNAIILCVWRSLWGRCMEDQSRTSWSLPLQISFCWFCQQDLSPQCRWVVSHTIIAYQCWSISRTI